MYVDYKFYASVYGGGLSEAEFMVSEAKAEAHVRYLTHVRGNIFAEEDDAVKMALCAAVDAVADSASAYGGGSGAAVKSESNDGYSVSYAIQAKDGETAESFARRKVFGAIRMYLLPTGWLSRSIRYYGG